MKKPLLEVHDLKVHYPVKQGINLSSNKEYVKAVDGVSFSINKGDALGLVGESGCGKTTIGHTIVNLVKPTRGEILYEGKRIINVDKRRQKKLAYDIQIIFQDPYSSLDPRFTVRRCIEEPLVIHNVGDSASRKEKVSQLMRDVGLNEEQMTKYPHEFSGGQRQRIGVARALALQPSLIVCDEPVSALDVSIQAQILNLMQDLREKYNLTYLFISHNLSVVYHICDRIVVMYLGKVMEISGKEDLFNDPRHPYTQGLLDAIPVPNPDKKGVESIIAGDVPSPRNPPSGCVFHTRCQYAQPICREEMPLPTEIGQDHVVFCHFAKEGFK